MARRVSDSLNSFLPQTTWLTAAEAASYLRIKPRTLLLWVNQGKVPAYALSGTKRRAWRFRQSDLDAALLQDLSPLAVGLCYHAPRYLCAPKGGSFEGAHSVIEDTRHLAVAVV